MSNATILALAVEIAYNEDILHTPETQPWFTELVQAQCARRSEALVQAFANVVNSWSTATRRAFILNEQENIGGGALNALFNDIFNNC